MTFAAVTVVELHQPQQIPLLGTLAIIVITWTQGATDGGGAIDVGYGTTAGNGEILGSVSIGNVKDKAIGSVEDAAAGTVTLDVDTTSGPTAGVTFVLVKKS